VEKTLESIEAELRGPIATAVAEGFSGRTDIIGRFSEVAEDEYGRDDLEPVVTRLTDAALTAHHRRQARWKGETDCDRLDAAFAALEQQGIVARQNFTCCSTCGHAEIGGEVAAARRRRRPVAGYAFYHMQDTEGAAEGGGVYIKYDCLADDRGRKTAVGHKIVEALGAAGLRADWNGDPDTAVYVRLKWRKRRPESEVPG
jgi:hypothetical protein